MYFVFLMALICFHVVYGSDLEPLNTENDELNLIVDKKVPKYFLKKIDPAIKNKENCDLRNKHIKVINNIIFEEEDIACDIMSSIIDKKNCKHHMSMGCIGSLIGGVGTGVITLIRCTANIFAPVFSSSIVLRNFLIESTQSILNFTAAAYIFRNPYNEKNENIHEFIECIFNDKKFKDQQFLKKEGAEEMHQQIIEKIKREYETVNSKKELMYKILPILHSALSLGGSVFTFLNTTSKEDNTVYVSQTINCIGSALALFFYVNSLMCDKQPSLCIKDIEIELHALLEKYQHEILPENV